jgi:hypothetical protein
MNEVTQYHACADLYTAKCFAARPEIVLKGQQKMGQKYFAISLALTQPLAYCMGMKTNKADCQFVKVLNYWVGLLATANQSDTAHIAYLQEKIESAKAIVQRREEMGKYELEVA